ncbi:MAG: bifunctional DNA primase/polymerase [Treponema sp.]|nr:bifunctional DNA primase/polymerase [Treponema sp.]
MTGYENLLVLRYRSAGMSGASALHFAQGEVIAIQEGRHWTHGRSTAPDPQRLIFQTLSDDEREQFTERAAIMEHDGGLNRADAETQAITEIIKRKYPAPTAALEKSHAAYHGSAALKKIIAAGVPLKDFYAKSKDDDPAAYTTDVQKIAAAWKQGVRRFKAFIRGRFVVIDIDRKPGKADGLASLYKLFPPDIMPRDFQDIPGASFPCYVKTPSGGFHLYFRYDGPELKLRELAPGIEIKERQITAPGSGKENGAYVLHGEFSGAPPLYGAILERIEEVKRKQEREKAERTKPRTRAAADRPMRFDRPRVTLDDLAGEAASAYAGHHDRQVSFAGKAYRCKVSPAETLAYVKSRADIFGNDTDTENTVLSVFRDNGGIL